MPARKPIPKDLRVRVGGRLFERTRPLCHYFVPTYPHRWVVSPHVAVGWNACDRCGRAHRIWMTDDAVWRRLPRRWRRTRICTRCFRTILEGR